MRFLIRVLVIFVLVMAGIAAIRRLLAPMFERADNSARQPSANGGRKSTGKLVADPVCGTYIAAASAPTLTRGETTFYFCSEECRSRFRETA
jgi:YHS domain-containing protein